MGELGKRLPAPFYKTLIIKFIVETRLNKITTMGKPKTPLLGGTVLATGPPGRPPLFTLETPQVLSARSPTQGPLSPGNV